MQQLAAEAGRRSSNLAQDQQLDRATASAPAPAAPAQKQKALADCARNPANMGTGGGSRKGLPDNQRTLPRTPNSQL
eukprot:scaffold104908_cov15-Tisochrysis_lutea.AAC.1